MNKVLHLGLSLMLLSFAGWAQADAANETAITAKLQTQGFTVDQIHYVESIGLYQVILQGDAGRLFFNADGSNFVYGDLFGLDNGIHNLSEVERQGDRARLLADYVEANGKHLIDFSGDEKKNSIYVFTDIDCGYCRQLHSQMQQYNDLGLEIRYLSFPRSGPGSRSFTKAISVWCNEDRQAAMTAAKSGIDPVPLACDEQQVAEQYQLGQSLGINGTPALVLSNGELIAGYLPPQALLSRIGGE